jgi:hypothetical protein
MIIIFFIIIIYILYINKKELFKNYNYQGPIIFLQKTDIEKKNCLDEMDYHQCIEKHPNDKYYPTNKELEYLNYPNIIKIPQGKKGINGLDGSPGINQGSTYRPNNNNITRITSKNYKNKLKIISNDNEINIDGDIKLQSFSKLCIQNKCIEGKDIEDIIKILK